MAMRTQCERNANHKPLTINHKPLTNNNDPSTPVIKPTKLNFADEDLKFSEWFYSKLLELNPKHKKPRNFDKWANTIRLIRAGDGKTYQEMEDLFNWVCLDTFWKGNILSPDKFRKQWDMLTIQMNKSALPRRDINAISNNSDFSAPDGWKNEVK